jgi:methylenetetrahydrofolate reductase (NADH)
MKIRDKFAAEPRTFSFEFSPPRTPDAVIRLFETAERLRGLAPTFVSVTYGAGGSTRRNTIDVVTRLQHELGITAAAHLTCVGHSRAELREILGELAARGIENLMLLRGDPPRDQPSFVPAPDGLRNAYELVRLARAVGDFSIGVAGYPEGHQECADKTRDLEHLKLKVESGADFVVTQLFFVNQDYFAFVERARQIGIRCRIVPGVMPALSWPQIQRMAKLCGASIPPVLARDLETAGDDRPRSEAIGIDWAMAQCEDLLRRGAPGIHLYTLNQSRAAEEIFAHLRKNLSALMP